MRKIFYTLLCIRKFFFFKLHTCSLHKVASHCFTNTVIYYIMYMSIIRTSSVILFSYTLVLRKHWIALLSVSSLQVNCLLFTLANLLLRRSKLPSVRDDGYAEPENL